MIEPNLDKINPLDWNHIIVSVSGGKDSSVLLLHALKHFPKDKIIAIHAVIDIDWKQTLPLVRRQCAQLSVPLIEVQAVDKLGKTKGFLSQLTSPRVNRKTKEVGEYQFPSMANRWCTSILKTGPIDKYCRSLRGNVLVLIGERHEESSQRAKLKAIRPDNKNSIASRLVVKYSPILKMSEQEVWATLKKNKVEIHPCYSWGIRRASCAICIFSSDKEIKIAASKDPNLVYAYIKSEDSIQHSFRYKPATKNRLAQKISIQDILNSQN